MASETKNLLTAEMKEAIQAYVQRYPDPRAALLPALHIVQDHYRCVPMEARSEIAEVLGISAAEVHDTATFYHGVYTAEPIGRHRVWICRSLSCALVGGEKLLDHVAEKLSLDLSHGRDTTGDGAFTVEPVECLGLCDGAPAMIVDGDVHTHLTVERVDEILESYRTKDV